MISNKLEVIFFERIYCKFDELEKLIVDRNSLANGRVLSGNESVPLFTL